MPAPATVSVFTILRDSTGAPISNAQVQCILNGGFITVAATGDAITNLLQQVNTDGNGRAAFTVVPNDLLSPANTTYTIKEPGRAYDIAPQSANGPTQQTTAANVIVNTPATLAPATSNVTGPLTVSGGLTISSGGLAVTGGTTTDTLGLTSGGISMPGPLTLTNNASQVVPGATSLSLRNNANNADNLLISNAGLVTARAGFTATAGDLTITSGRLVFGAAAGKIVPGATSLSHRNNADSADNLLIVDNGDATFRARVLMATAVSKLVPGATSFSHRNNADSADNLLIVDNGLTTLRNALSMPASAAGAVATSSYGSVPVKIQELSGAVGTGGYSFTNIPTTFRSLQLQMCLRSTDATAGLVNHLIRLNNDSTTANYRQQNQRTSSTVTAAPTENIGTAAGFNLTMYGGGVAAGFHSAGECWFWNYSATVTVYKVGQYRTVAPQLMTGSGNFEEEYSALVYQSAAATAVTRIDVIPAATGFDADSYVALWGYP